MTLDEIHHRCTECGECWHWNGYGGERGHYPQVRGPGGKVLQVRRVAFQLRFGEIKDGMKILPVCGDPKCVNPEHQRSVTESQKSRRAAARGAYSSITRAAKIAAYRRANISKLTPEQVQAIRASSDSGPVLAEQYGINRSMVNSIKAGRTWKDYSNPFKGLMP